MLAVLLFLAGFHCGDDARSTKFNFSSTGSWCRVCNFDLAQILSVAIDSCGEEGGVHIFFIFFYNFIGRARMRIGRMHMLKSSKHTHTHTDVNLIMHTCPNVYKTVVLKHNHRRTV